MKSSSKNKYSGKSFNQYDKNSNFKFFSKNKNSSERKDSSLINSAKKNGPIKSNESDKNKSNFSSSKNRKPITRSNLKVSNKASQIYQESSSKRNFDDWIWGKHSVYEALISERAINRIWCTSEIFSSEKFYILLKELKSKGVLIEEVSWNRLRN